MKHKRVFVAGASGAVGLPLCQLLIDEGFEVYGTTRKTETAKLLSSIGVKPVVVDVYDKEMLKESLQRAKPDYVIHQLTDLPYGLPQDKMEEGRRKNERIRLEGTANLIEACGGLSIQKFVAQSIAFMYAEGKLPHTEEDTLASDALRKFESLVLGLDGVGVILRYGRFYGPRTGVESVAEPCRVHVLAAAKACLLVLLKGYSHIFNVVEDVEYASNWRIIQETGWDPNWRG